MHAKSEFAPRLGAAALVAILALAGCQSGGDNGLAGVDTTAPAPPQEKITQTELNEYCPPITIREGTASFNTYAKGGDGDAGKIIYQASIADATRACKRANGQMTITVAVAGRIVPGPLVQTGSITMPIRVVVLMGKGVAYSQLHQHQVNISDTGSATQFVFKDPNVVVPVTEAGARIFVGFDEGPDKVAPGEES